MSEEMKPCPPVLVRDLAEILGRAVPDVMSAFIVAGLAPHSPNMAVSGEDALAVAAILKQQRQDCEPFGYFRPEPFGWTDCAPDDEGAIPLYAAPPKRDPLSDAEITAIRRSMPFDDEDLPDPWDFAHGFRAAEKAHGIGGQS